MKTALACLLAAALLLGEAPQGTEGNSLRCYTCVSMPNDLTCLEDPDSVTSSVPITECEMEGDVCCTITRMNFKEDESQLHSFARGCTDKCPRLPFERVEDATHVTYITRCDTPECNIGPGDRELDKTGADNAKSNEIWGVQGLPSSAAALTASLASLTALLILLRLQ